MTKQDAKKIIIEYIKEFNLEHKLLDADGKPISGPMPLKELDTIYLSYKIIAPGDIAESDIHLFDDRLLARVYYDYSVAEVCKNAGKKQLSELYRVMNFINESLFMGYNIPLCPTAYVSTDGSFDIGLRTMIDYRILELLPQDVLDYLTIFYPQLLEQLAYPIIGIITGKFTAPVAINYIKKEIMGDDDPLIEFDGGSDE